MYDSATRTSDAARAEEPSVPASGPTRQRAARTPREAPQRRHAPAAPAKTQPTTATDGPVPQLATLQSAIGNQAVQRLMQQRGMPAASATVTATPKHRLPQNPGPTGPATINRLIWTSDEFKKNTDAGFLASRGKTLKEIQKQLDQYHGLWTGNTPPQSLPTIEQAIEMLTHMQQNTEAWLDLHSDDTSRSKNRMGGMRKFLNQIKAIDLPLLTKMRDSRLKSMSDKGLEATPKPISENKFQTQMQGDVKSVFSKLGPLIMLAAPNSGDAGTLEVELKVPIEPSGVGFLGFRLTAGVERGVKSATKLRVELALTGGAQIPNVVELKGELGGYIEAQGASAEKALELCSYGLYRRFRESRFLPNEITNFMWGGSTSSVGWKRAEKWAAKVEKENFKKQDPNDPLSSGPVAEDEQGAYVETGGLAGASGTFGMGGVAKGQVGAKFTTGKHYDYDSIKNINKKKGGKKLGEAEAVPLGMRGGGKAVGESVHALEISGSAEGGPFSGSLKFTWKWSTEGRTGAATLTDFAVELSAGAQIPMGELVAQGIGGAIPPLVASISDTIRAAMKESSTKVENAGAVISAGTNVGLAFSQLAQLPTTAFVPEYKFDVGQVTPDGISAPTTVKITASMNKNFEAEFKLEYVKGLNASFGVLAAKIEKSQRLLRIGYKPDSGWKVD
jgi:hypothetical protein